MYAPASVLRSKCRSSIVGGKHTHSLTPLSNAFHAMVDGWSWTGVPLYLCRHVNTTPISIYYNATSINTRQLTG